MVEAEISVAAPPDRVFAYLADPRNRPAWQSSLRSVADVRPAPDGSLTGAGVTWTDVTVVPGVRPAMEIVESDGARLWVEEGRFGPVSARLSLTFEPAPGGTLVRADFRVRGLLVGGLVTAASRRTVAADLRRAARILSDPD